MKKLSTTEKLLASYILLVVAVAGLSMAMALPKDLLLMEERLEQALSRTAYILAYDESVIEGLERGRFPAALQERLDGILKRAQGSIDYLVVADRTSRRLYHPSRSHIGEQFIGGDEADALAGKDEYITTWKGDPDSQKRAFHTVRNDAGEVVGFVMASTSTQHIEEFRRQIILRNLELLALVVLAGAMLAWAVSSNLRHILLGYDPTTFARMYLQREEILDNLGEGIAVVDRALATLYRNPAAKAYVGEDTLSADSPLCPGVQECFRTERPVPWYMVEVRDGSFLAGMVPLRPIGELDAVMVILRERTELVKMSERLTGLNHIIDALRANTHEYRNKLHILYGMLQLGETRRAMDFLGAEAQDALGHNVLHLVEDKTVAALVLGKANRAKELNIDFRLRGDSRLPEHAGFLSAKEMVTIIGNLVENAYEAMEGRTEERQVELFLQADGDGLTIAVDDTGCGMEPAEIQRILDGPYTTKGMGHGYGMRLVQEIVGRRKGFLQIDSEPGTGTSITVSIPKTQQGGTA